MSDIAKGQQRRQNCRSNVVQLLPGMEAIAFECTLRSPKMEGFNSIPTKARQSELQRSRKQMHSIKSRRGGF